jgi:hypothetical protein
MREPGGDHLFIPRHTTAGVPHGNVSTASPVYASPPGVRRASVARCPALHPSHVGDVVAASRMGPPAAGIKYFPETRNATQIFRGDERGSFSSRARGLCLSPVDGTHARTGPQVSLCCERRANVSVNAPRRSPCAPAYESGGD